MNKDFMAIKVTVIVHDNAAYVYADRPAEVDLVIVDDNERTIESPAPVQLLSKLTADRSDYDKI